MTQVKKKIILLTTGLILTICLMAFFGVYALTILKNSTFNVGVKYEPEYLVKVEMGIDGANGETGNQTIEETEYVEIFNSLNPVSNGIYIDSMSNDTIHLNSQTLTPIGANGDVYFRITSLENETGENKDLQCVIDCGSSTADSGKLVIKTPKILTIATGINATSGTPTSSSLGMIKISLKFSEFVLDFVDLKDLDSNSSTELNFGELGTIKHNNITGKTFYVSNIDGLLKLSALVGKINTTKTEYGSNCGYDNSAGRAVPFSGATIQMLNDIDCENGDNKDNFSKKFIPIGNETNSFRGTFDGNNKTITGLYIYQETDNAGLFGYVSNAEIKDLTIQNGKVISGAKLLNTNQTSSLTEMFSCFSNVKKRGLKMQTYKPVSIPSYNVGNFVAYVDNSLISHCSAEETEVINSTGRVGGIVGVSAGATITNCLNMGNVYGSAAGGIVGGSTSEGLIIINCSNTGNIIEFFTSSTSIAPSSELGGIVGLVNGTATIINSYNFGSVGFGRLGCGGIVGYVDAEMAKIIIRNCYNTADIEGSGLRLSGAGGIVGYVKEAEIKIYNCYNTGVIKEGYIFGGIVGTCFSGTTTITNCYNTGSVSGTSEVGGIVGLVYGTATITNCYNTGSVSGTSEVGGIVGLVYGTATITNCYNTGSVSGTSKVGGIVGFVAPGETATITNCYYSSSVNASLNGVGVNDGTLTSSSYYGTFISAGSGLTKCSDSPSELAYGTSNLITVLNAYVSDNPVYTDETSGLEIELTTWEIRAGENDGYPVFA